MTNEERQPNINTFESGLHTEQALNSLPQAQNLRGVNPDVLRQTEELALPRMKKFIGGLLAYRTQKLVQGQIVSFSTRNPEIDIEKAIQDEIAASMADIIHYGMVIREEENPGSEFKIYTIMTSDGKHQIIPAGSLRPVTADKLSGELLSGIFADRSFKEENGIIIMEVLPGDLQVSNVTPSKTANPSRK